MSTVVMEREFEQPPTDEELEKMKQTTEACLEVNDVTRLQTLASPDRKRCICIFEARDLESVRRAIESAKVDYVRMWSASVF